MTLSFRSVSQVGRAVARSRCHHTREALSDYRRSTSLLCQVPSATTTEWCALIDKMAGAIGVRHFVDLSETDYSRPKRSVASPRSLTFPSLTTSSPGVAAAVSPLGALPTVARGPCAPVSPIGPCGPTAPVRPVGPVRPACGVIPRAPISPVGPCAPEGPVPPAGPVGPSVAGPCGPVLPTTPRGPAGPLIPVAPALPGTLGEPCAPVAPVFPWAPVAPGGPEGPARPITHSPSLPTAP